MIALEKITQWVSVKNSKKGILVLSLFLSQMVLAQSDQCHDPENEITCSEVSLEKFGYISSDCQKVQNDAQDLCAAQSIRKFGYVSSDCLKLVEGGRCALKSMEKFGYISSDCQKVQNRRQDRCAVASIEKFGYISSDCFKL